MTLGAQMPDLPTLRPAVRIVDAVHEALRDAILSGSLVSGSQLSVPDLARRLDVSRSPVREAVLQLVAEGLAVEQPRKGVVVATIEAGDIIEIHEIREFVESLSARLCAERIEKTALQNIEQILVRQTESVKNNDAQGYFETNIAFHSAIADAGRNYRLKEIISALENQMRIGLRFISSDPEQRRAGLAEHTKILAAIRSKKADLAESLMREHIARTKNNLDRKAKPKKTRRNAA
jgi:DNA-binding GntR family transcriptional regulator